MYLRGRGEVVGGAVPRPMHACISCAMYVHASLPLTPVPIFYFLFSFAFFSFFFLIGKGLLRPRSTLLCNSQLAAAAGVVGLRIWSKINIATLIVSLFLSPYASCD